MLPVFVPSAGAPLRAVVAEGSGIVGEERLRAGAALIYYQLPTPAVNVVSYADRVYHAADRLRHRAPTTLRCAAGDSELTAIGHFDEAEGRVILTEPDAEALLARWLGQAHLDRSELACRGTEHFARLRAGA